jgi:hypothetical protein
VDSERAIELHEKVADDPDPFALWAPSVRRSGSSWPRCTPVSAGPATPAGKVTWPPSTRKRTGQRHPRSRPRVDALRRSTGRQRCGDSARCPPRVGSPRPSAHASHGPLWSDRRRPWRHGRQRRRCGTSAGRPTTGPSR